MQENPLMNPPDHVPPANNTIVQVKKKPVAFILSIILFIIVIGFSAGFFALNIKTESDIRRARSEVETLDLQIASAKQNKTILIANILDQNLLKPSINLESLISTFRSVARTSGVQFKGFHIANNILTTDLIATEAVNMTIHSDPVTSILAMMRGTTTADGNLTNTDFELEPITHISGTPTARTTNISFKIVPKTSNQ